jgi:hypothetical protein
MAFWKKRDLNAEIELARQEAERAAAEADAKEAERQRTDSLLALGASVLEKLDETSNAAAAFVRILEDMHAPKLKYHVVFSHQGAYGDLVVDLSRPLDTLAGLNEVKAEIRTRLNFEAGPVIIGWHPLES